MYIHINSRTKFNSTRYTSITFLLLFRIRLITAAIVVLLYITNVRMYDMLFNNTHIYVRAVKYNKFDNARKLVTLMKTRHPRRLI